MYIYIYIVIYVYRERDLVLLLLVSNIIISIILLLTNSIITIRIIIMYHCSPISRGLKMLPTSRDSLPSSAAQAVCQAVYS